MSTLARVEALRITHELRRGSPFPRSNGGVTSPRTGDMPTGRPRRPEPFPGADRTAGVLRKKLKQPRFQSTHGGVGPDGDPGRLEKFPAGAP